MLPSLGEIERRRRLLGLSQKRLSKLADVSQSMIAKIESGRANPSYLKTKAIFDTIESLERRNETKAKDICHAKVVGVQSQDPVSRGVRVMRETSYSQLPVFSGHQVVGSITEKTILEKLVSTSNPSEVSRLTVDRIMDSAFPTLSEETPVSMVSTLLQFEPAVLVTRRGNVVGIITKADLLKVVGT